MILAAGDDPDEIEDYEYFEHRRKAHLDALQDKKNLEYARKREIKKIKSLSWRNEGVKVLSSLQGTLANLKSVLIPHHHMKLCMAQLTAQTNVVKENLKTKSCANNRHYSILILRTVNPPERKFRLNINLIFWQTSVMQAVRLHYILRHLYEEDFYPLPVRWRTFRNLFRIIMRYVPVPRAVTTELKKKRLRYKQAKKKLDLIRSTMRACEYILVCKSMQHSNPKGCSHCGVLYIGGTLGGANLYVTSYSRDTGVPTLVTLDFEVETLQNEEVVQLAIVEEAQTDLAVFEKDVTATVVLSIQRWWGFVLAWKRIQRRERHRTRSLYWDRIRRLSLMKRELDVLILEAAPIDMVYCSEKYCDFVPELVEYVTVITERKRIRMLRWTLTFRKKLAVIVEHARYLRYLESLKVKPVVIVEKPIVFKTPQPLDKRQFVCFRMECRLRKFLTAERYETHMAVHRKSDVVRYAKYDRDREAKKERGAVEKDFLLRVRDSRAYLAESNMFELCDYSVEEHFARIIPPPAEVEVVSAAASVSSGGSSKMSSLLTAGYDFHARIGNSVLAEVKAEAVEIEPLHLPTPYDYRDNAVAPATLPWVAMPHIYNLNGLLNSPLFSLEMVSKQGDVEVASRVPLDQPIIRIGTHSSCECRVQTRGAAKREGKISQIHCLLYCSMSSTSSGSQAEDVTLVDNSSGWGTYVVSAGGTRKVPTKITAGLMLTAGLLICIGVCKDGAESLSATEANGACVVYRVRCLELEG